MIREDVELFIWRGRRRGADVACSLADLDRANHRELEAMNDREWATKLADSIWVSLIPRIWGLALPDNPITVKELIQEQLLLAIAKRDAERQPAELSADDVTRAWRSSGACVPDEPSFIAGLNALLREKRSGK